jgi:transcriptional regulator with XRE-family HTH domain
MGNLQKKIRAAIALAGLRSEAELAQRVGVSRTALGLWIRGEKPFPPSRWCQVCQILRVPAAYFENEVGR